MSQTTLPPEPAPAQVTQLLTDGLKQAVHDLTETVRGEMKTQSEKLVEVERVLKDVQAEQAKTKKFALFPEFDPDFLKYDSTPATFDRLMASKPAADAPEKALVEELQRQNDQLYIKQLINTAMVARGRRPVDLKKSVEKWGRLTSQLAKALDTATTGEGLEWVPTGFSQQLLELIVLEQRVVALFPTFPMPTDPYKWPFSVKRPVSQVVTETTTTPPTALADAMRAFTGNTPTANVQFDAKKLRALEVYTREWADDTVGPALPWLFRQLAMAIADGEEDAFINGDDDGSHFDSDVTGASPKTLLKGFRRYAIANGYKTDLASFDDTHLRQMRGKMGVYGTRLSSLAYITGIQGALCFLDKLPNVQTLDKYGPNAVVFTGELAKHDSVPIIASEFMREDLDDTGVYSAIGTKTGVLLVHRDRWMKGTRPGLEVESDRNIVADETVIVAFDRLDLQQVDATTAHSLEYGVNVSPI